MNPSLSVKTIIFALLTFALLSYGLYQARVVAPTEATMGDIQRIFYYHVPSAFVAFTCFFINLMASLAFLRSRSLVADAWAVSTAEVGVVFCTVVLVTGPLWARPVWGTWWSWDARLTSTLLLWLIYVSYLLLRRYAARGQAPVLGAVLAVFGSVDTVFVYMSIRWFRTHHPQPVLGAGGSLDPAMHVALWTNVLAFACFAALVIWIRFRLERLQQQIEAAYALRAVRA